MFCIKCQQPHTHVTNSRRLKKSNYVWRRRSCPNCGAVFTTVETPQVTQLYVVNHHNKRLRERFSLPRLTVSLAAVLRHRRSPAEDAYWLATTILEKHSATTEVSLPRLMATALETLEYFDVRAAKQYGAIHNL